MVTSGDESGDEPLRRALEAALGGDLNSLGARLRELGDIVDRMLNATADDPEAARAVAAELIAKLGLREEQVAEVRDALESRSAPVHEVSDTDTGNGVDLEGTIAIAVHASATMTVHEATILIEQAEDTDTARQGRLSAAVILAAVVTVPLASGQPTTAAAFEYYIRNVTQIVVLVMYLFGDGRQ
jgi:hypothetical protein